MSLVENITIKPKVSASLNRGMGATILDAHNTLQRQNKLQASLIHNTGGHIGGRRRKRGGSTTPVCASAPNVPSVAPTYLGGNSNKMSPNGNQNIFSALTAQKSQVANSALDNTGGWASVKTQSGGAPDLGNFIESLNNMSGGAADVCQGANRRCRDAYEDCIRDRSLYKEANRLLELENATLRDFIPQEPEIGELVDLSEEKGGQGSRVRRRTKRRKTNRKRKRTRRRKLRRRKIRRRRTRKYTRKHKKKRRRTRRY